MPPDQCPVEYVSNNIIRQAFNRLQIEFRANLGELSKTISRNSHLAHPPEGIPYCTNSQIIYYYEQGNILLAVAHQYLLPDGTLGGSGKPDPKRLILSDRILAVRSAAPAHPNQKK